MFASVVCGQTAQPIPHDVMKLSIDSGPVRNLGRERAVIYSMQIDAPVAGTPWMRLHFAKAQLGRTPVGGMPTQLKITSTLDGKYQTMNAIHLEQWQNSSAYFNGDSVILEVIADGGAPHSHIVVDEIMVGTVEQGGIASICGANDDRVLSDDPRAARIVPIGCTGWLIDDANHCFLSAGHCTVLSGTIEFNVPLSTSGGSIQHPGPEDQYAVDASSSQGVNGGVGNDWWYFGCFPNSNTGLTPYEAQGDFYTVAKAAPEENGQTIRITGYGVDSTPQQNNQVQQTHAGPYVELDGTVVRHQADTTGGNSGSAVFNETDGEAIGIHTHAGCNSGGGANQGTAIQHNGLQNALANPDGLCIPMPSLAFVYPDGLPVNVNPGGDSIRVEVAGSNGGEPESGTGMVHVDVGGGFVSAAMVEVSPNVYDAMIPASVCGATVKFYFSAQDVKGEVVLEPANGAAGAFGALAAVEATELLYDALEATPTAWGKANDPAMISGGWNHGDPVGTTQSGNLAAPENDATPGPGTKALVTQNGIEGGGANADDVDGGPTAVLSPVLNLANADAIVSYAQWFYSNSAADVMTVSISNDGGMSWVDVDTVDTTSNGTNTAWEAAAFRVSDFVAPSSQVRVRYSVIDVSPDNVVEAGIDEFRVTQIVCGGCAADIDATGDVDVNDLLIVLNAWGPCAGCAADVDGSGTVDVNDLLAVVNAWGACQ
jgi:V8-like Glu-specific endopeptidase